MSRSSVPRSIQGEPLAVGRRNLTPPIPGPALVMVGVRDAWGLAHLRLSDVRIASAALASVTQKRVGPAGEVPLWIPEGCTGSVELECLGINDKTVFGPISANGFADGNTAAAEAPVPRAWVRRLPASAGLPYWRGQTVLFNSLAGADIASIGFVAAERDVFAFPLGAARNFAFRLDQQANIDLVDAAGTLISRLGASVQTYQGSLGPWEGLKIRNLSGVTAATGQVHFIENMQRWV